MSEEIICLNPQFSTTRRVTRKKSEYVNELGEKFETSLFWPIGAERKAEGGLRTQGYFKQNLPEKPLITIVTVVYNGAACIEETILSVLSQAYDNIEYLIIDGASTDDTIKIIQKYQNAVDYYFSEPDKGLYDAMNKGAMLSFGEWVNFMNAGDRLLLLDTTSLFKRLATTTCYYFDERYSKIIRRPLSKLFLCRNTPCHQAVFYKKEEFLLYKLDYPVIADFEQMTRLCKDSIFHRYHGSIVYYAKPGISSVCNSQKSLRHSWERAKIIYANIGLFYFFVAVFHMLRVRLRSFVLGRMSDNSALSS